jgi:hypothetical protein
MPDEYASRRDLDGIGERISSVEVNFARFQGSVDKSISTIQCENQIQFEKIDCLEDHMHVLELGIQKMRDDVIGKISGRISLVVGLATILILGVQIVVMIQK